ncbi:helix-hairpin-helix domain-containing protein [Nocardiopsis flavescens]
MTPRHDQQERLRALGLDASPAARRLRARIPRPVPEPAEGIPSAPYSVDDWPERDPYDRAPTPPEPDSTRTVRTPPPRDPPPWSGARVPPPPPYAPPRPAPAEQAQASSDGTTERLRPRGGRRAGTGGPPGRNPAAVADPASRRRDAGSGPADGGGWNDGRSFIETGGSAARGTADTTENTERRSLPDGGEWKGGRSFIETGGSAVPPVDRPSGSPRAHGAGGAAPDGDGWNDGHSPTDTGGPTGRYTADTAGAGRDRRTPAAGRPVRGAGGEVAGTSPAWEGRGHGSSGRGRSRGPEPDGDPADGAPPFSGAERGGRARAEAHRGRPGQGPEGADLDGGAGVPRVPSGYTEFLPRRDGGLLERLARRWPPEATMSRRAVAALLVVALLAVAAVLFLRERPEAVAPETVAHTIPAEEAVPSAAGADPEADLVVHVGGEVEDPGLYTLPPGSRVADAVESAGGPLPDADLDLLNLARSLVDGEQILVGLPQPGAAAPVPGTAEGPLVDINRADEAELEALPRVGEVTARNIVSYREANGPFTSVDDLINVDRIGARTLEEIRPHATVG